MRRGSVKALPWLSVGVLATSTGLALGCGSEKEPAATASSLQPAAQAPVEQKPPSPEYYKDLDMARQLLGENKGQESLAPLDRCRAEQPDAFAVHNNYCVAYAMIGRKDDAVLACQKALQIDPTNQLAKNNLAWVSSLQPATATR